MTGVGVLTERVVLASLRDHDLLFGILAPVVTFLGFNTVLQNVIDTGGMSYAQYVLPAVVVQAMLLGALTTTERAAIDRRDGIGIRLRTLAISTAAPLTARMLYCLLRGSLAVAAGVAVAYVYGFRVLGGPIFAAAFVVVALLLTLALSLGADAVGSLGYSMDGASQLLLIPQLLLVLLSTGMAPVSAFPDWIEPFVRNQPISQVTTTLRGLATGHVIVGNLVSTLAWCAGLILVFGALALRMQRRTQ
jgi:ABC-2 type transport system permease protein